MRSLFIRTTPMARRAERSCGSWRRGCWAGLQAGVHQGYAGLVDLKTGDLVWFNLDPLSGGDPRDAEGAAKRVRELLTAFPTSGPAAAPAAPAAR